jgi:hypothetical protein
MQSQPAERGCSLLWNLLLLPSIALIALGGVSRAAEEEPVVPPNKKDSCVDCHSERGFLVTNKKLYDYYKEWEVSVHREAEVGCSDCHGGNPAASDEEGAHGGEVGEAAPQSAVNFRNIPKTCGECHKDFLNAYQESAHFEHLVAEGEEAQGPSCVTCHGSMSVGVLDVNTVQDACARCHNEETENNPHIPEEAKLILNKLLSISRFYRYIAVRGDPVETRAFFEKAGAAINELAVGWHTFDLEVADEKTAEVLTLLRAKRNGLRKDVAKESDVP